MTSGFKIHRLGQAAWKYLGRLSLCALLSCIGSLFFISLFFTIGRSDLWPDGASSMVGAGGGRFGFVYQAPDPDLATGRREVLITFQRMTRSGYRLERTRGDWYGYWHVFLGPPQNASRFISMRIPLWPMTLLCWPVALFLFRPVWRFAKRPESACFNCGYDVRGSMHAERCPECGARIPDAARQHSQPT